MANITLGTLRDYWKRVYDAITGPPGSAAPTYAMQVGGTDGTNLRALKTDASGNLSVLLNGSKIEQVALVATPLAAGAAFTGAWTANSDGRAVGLLIAADTLVQVQIQFARDGTGNGLTSAGYNYSIVVDPTAGTSVFVPPIRVGPYYRIKIVNPTATAQAVLNVQEIRQYGGISHRQALTVGLLRNLAIRDTAAHHIGTDPQYAFAADIGLLGDGTHPIFVRNNLDQQISVTIYYLGGTGWGAALGTFTVAAGAMVVKTNTDYPGLDIPTQRLYLSVTAAATPTLGAVDAYTVSMVGG